MKRVYTRQDLIEFIKYRLPKNFNIKCFCRTRVNGSFMTVNIIDKNGNLCNDIYDDILCSAKLIFHKVYFRGKIRIIHIGEID